MTELPDRLLRDALRDGMQATTSNVCVDADALAAWADGTMGRAARAAFEIHAADCARCQALMAAMLRSAPASEMRAAWWRRSPVSWLMPLAAAAAAAVIVVNLAVTERRAPASLVARTEMPANSTVPPSTPTAQAAPPSAAGAPAPGAESRRDTNAAMARTSRSRATGSSAEAARPQVPTPEARAKVAAEPAQPTPVPPPAAASPAPSLAASKDLTAAAAAGTAPARDAASRTEANRAAPLTAKAEQSLTLMAIASPDRGSSWRIAGGAVEHTIDGGSTWQPQALGDAPAIRAGVAPGARVCWLVGLRGVVLLTTDGASWRRIAFPEPVNLVAVQASDGAHATVTTSAGGRYSTNDGGTTWIRQ